MSGYSTRDVADLLGISTTQVRSFVRAGLSSLDQGKGRYRFSFEDIVLLRAAKELIEAHISPRKVWSALKRLRDQLPSGKSLSSVKIVAQGDQIVVKENASTWYPDSGQFSFSFAVEEVASQVAPLVRKAAKTAHSKQNLSSDDWYELGLDLELISATTDAKIAYRLAIELDRSNADAHINFGRLLQMDGNTTDAERHYREALEATPENATAIFNLGTVLEDQGRPTEAIEAYTTAISFVPEFADAHYNLAQLYEKRGDGAIALQHFSRYRSLINTTEG